MVEPEQSRFGRIAGAIRGWRGRALSLLAVVAAVVGVAVIASGGGDSDSADSEATTTEAAATTTGTTVTETTAEGATTVSEEQSFAEIEFANSSWIAGQGSLISYDGYLSVVNRADDVARTYQETRDKEAIRQEKLTGLQRKAAREAARRRALAAYRAALRRARLLQKRQEERLRRQRERIRRRLAYLREKYKVDPGEECQIPEVQEAFDCTTGYPF